MLGRLGFGLAILALPGALGACDAARPPGTAAAAPAGARCPAPGWGANVDRVRLPTEQVWNRVSLDRHGAIHWNGAPIDPLRLRQYMDLVATMNPLPETYLEVDPDTPCDAVARVVGVIDAAVDCSRLCTYKVKPWRAE